MRAASAGGGGRAGPRGRVRVGARTWRSARLGFAEAAFGVRRDLEIERLVTCDRCMGNGAEPGTAPIACRTCGGAGEVQSVRRSVFGTLMTSHALPTCGGTGQEIPDPCESCFGRGEGPAAGDGDRRDPRRASRTGWSCASPARATPASAGGPPGDLFVRLEVEESTAFERRGQDLFTVLDVTRRRRRRSARRQVEGLDGAEPVKVEPGTDSGTVVRLKGKGIPNVQRRGRGDLYVTVHVSTPRDLSKEERGLLERLAELRGEGDERDRQALRRPSY